MSDIVEALINSLLSSPKSNSSPKLLTEVSLLLHSAGGRDLFVTALDAKSIGEPIEESSLLQLAGLLNALLTAMESQGDRSAEVFFKVVALSQVVCMRKSNLRYLNSLIGSHSIFKDIKRWEEAIDWTITTKVQAESRSFHQSGEDAKGFRKTRFADEHVERAAAFMTMSRFIYYMLHMNVPIVIASEIIMKVSTRVHLDTDKVTFLLAELQGNRPVSRLRRSSKWRRYITKISCKKKRWGNLLPVLCVVPYLEWADQSKLLSLNKTCYRSLTPIVMKSRLQQYELAEEGSRKLIWLILLKPYMPSVDYQQLKNSLATLPLVRDIEAVIAADLPRSYPNSSQVEIEKLGSVLRVFAVYNSRVGYCQGLNYVAGTLYWVMQDEELAFLCLAAMFQYLELGTLYENSLSKLKESYYVLDRLVGLNLPDLHYAFQARMVSSRHFATSWILTMFGNLLHYSADKAEVLFAIWDDILIVRSSQRGWKPIFKTCVAILQKLAPILITMSFEEMMMVLTSAVKPDCIVDVLDSDLMEEYSKVVVNNELLRELRTEYESLTRRFNLN
jgi:hypothetical protein